MIGSRRDTQRNDLSGEEDDGWRKNTDRSGDSEMSRESRIKKGDLVNYDDVSCRVLKRRRVTGMAMFSTCDYEVCLETLNGKQVGWVPENEVMKVSDEAGEP